MKHTSKYLLSLLLCTLMSVSAMSQMFVWKNGQMILIMETGVADSITFVKPHDPLKDYKFSVSASLQVRFSKGNLQYNMYYGDWNFADNQYDVIGNNNSKLTDEAYEGNIDLFGWGTSGEMSDVRYHDPYESSTNYEDYVIGEGEDAWKNDLIGTYYSYDWGSNAITNGGNLYFQWRTLTNDEWEYLILKRDNAASKFALATVNGKCGLIILADDWKGVPEGLSFKPSAGLSLPLKGSEYYDENADNNYYSTNIYSKDDWMLMENNGAMFLPAAGQRNGTNVQNVNAYGRYWSTTTMEEKRNGNVHSLSFMQNRVAPVSEFGRAWGCSVRLVQDIKK